MENLQLAVNWLAPQFPPEVWGLIIKRMETSEDISAVLRAYPRLKGLAENKEFHWRISEILWLILPNYISDQDTLNCRLVCKFWKRSVDRLLENHPRRLPYNSPRLPEMTERHFTCFKYPEIRTTFHTIFTDVMDNHVVADINGQNPFLGKYLYIYTLPRSNCHLQRMRKIANFLKLLGYHIHHIVIDFFMVHQAETEQMMYLLFQCLSFLPNLRSLKIKGKFSCDKETCRQVFGNIWGKGRRIHFPANLESLDLAAVWFDFDYFGLYTGLLNQTNGNQLKKFGLDLGYWNKTLARRLPNLADLIISHIDIHREERIDATRRLRKMFRVLAKSCKNLRRLSIAGRSIEIDKLFKFLQNSNIEMLDLEEIWESPERNLQIIPSLPSIKYMKFKGEDDNTLNLYFLKALPNLEWLKVSMSGFNLDSDYEHTSESGYKASVWGLSDSIFGYLFMDKRHPGGFCIWKEFPKLKMITLAPSDEDEDCPPSWERLVREFGNKMLTAEYVSCHYYMDCYL